MTRRNFLAASLIILAPALAKPIQRVAVASTNLKSVGFDPKTKTLEVEFIHGGVYRYYEVPAEIHSGLINAESKGKYFQTNVRQKFRFERISGGK